MASDCSREDRTAFATGGEETVAGCYEEMRRIARRLLASESDRRLFQPTELAHEAAIRLLMLEPDRFQTRAHMLATAARITRRALLDEVRSRRAAKRTPVLLTIWPEREQPARLDELDSALEELAAMSPDHARIIELRFSLGMDVEEVAASEQISPRTVKRRWAAARAWLQTRIESGE
ncbi:ECF-type sigma factor [Sphingomonas sp.]|uniref:ECF-type sigma factor n=1 Tax=Sphingomonas sp. TaxID=28214 RepID=UPI000DB5F6C0|nr:ECF-type sigma factor [Sphingomonas sp.]PZU10022.1 MAG: RNA polymerase subunit sigma-70 [Sphingomonas sp.]